MVPPTHDVQVSVECFVVKHMELTCCTHHTFLLKCSSLIILTAASVHQFKSDLTKHDDLIKSQRRGVKFKKA